MTAARAFASMLLGIGLRRRGAPPLLPKTSTGPTVSRIPNQGGWALPCKNPVIDGPAALVDEGQVKIRFGGHAPISALGPLVVRDYSGE